VNADGTMTTLTPFFVDGAAETCWNYLSRTTQEPLMYTSAYFDSSVGMSRINADGTLSLLNSRVTSTAASGTTRPQIDLGGLDMYGAVDTSGAEYVYVLHNPVVQPLGLPLVRIVGYRIHPEDGSLTQLGESVARDIPNNGFGLWAY
jgi:6-phosphogluconolactonase (cycloisomerase 2 family)